MHTKIKEFIDVHFRRFDEITIEKNRQFPFTPVDFHKVELEFIQIRKAIVDIKDFLDTAFDDNLQIERDLYLLFCEVVKNFLLLLDMDISVASKLDAKAHACGKYGYFEYKRDSKERNRQSDITRIMAQKLVDENTKAVINTPNQQAILARGVIYEVGKESGGWKGTIDTFNTLIKELIEEDDYHSKTDILFYSLDYFMELSEEMDSMTDCKNTTLNLNIIIHFRLFLDCLLAINGDGDIINEMYLAAKVNGGIKKDVPTFVKLMIKISDLLDRAIVYLYENIDTDSKNYYPILESKIRDYLLEYPDENTGWNRI